MQIPIISGIFIDTNPDVRTKYPKNLMPVPKQSGISAGYLRPHDGLVEITATEGLDRGGINWNGILYRVIGNYLVKVNSDNSIETIGYVGNDSLNAIFTYSFDRLAVVSNKELFYYDGTTFEKVTDADLGDVLDVVWVDGYFMTTDGEFLVVTELSDPTQINPLKYGSSEANPDPIVSLIKLQNEIYAVNRHTIEVFDNVGGSAFPFARVESAQIDRGCVGTNACCEYLGGIAFIGSKLNESISVWIGANSTSTKISTKEIDYLLLEYTEEELSKVLLESRVDKTHQFLYIHLEDKTLVYDAASSSILGSSIWFVLDSDNGKYKAKNFIWCYDKWIFGDPTFHRLGYLDDSVSTHFNDVVEWEFSTAIIYNESRGAILHQIELVGFNPSGTGVISTDYSLDGLNYSKPISVLSDKRLVWFQQGMMEDRRIQRFKGNAHTNILRLEVQISPLYV